MLGTGKKQTIGTMIFHFNKMSTLNKKMITTSASLAQAASATRARQFIVASFDASGMFSASARPAFHPSMASAVSEAERLSGLNPGKLFVPLQIVGGKFLPASPAVQTL